MEASITWVHFDLIAVFAVLPIVLFYLLLYKMYFPVKKNTAIGHLTVVFVALWLNGIVEVFPSSWEPTVIQNVIFIPPLRMLLSIGIIGYMAAIVWNMWWNDKDVELT